MACDICGKTGTQLTDLRDEYKTDDISALCPSCEKVINDKLTDVRLVTHNILKDLLKRFMRNLKAEKNG